MTNSSLLEACQLGEALKDELVIDIHGHLGPWGAFYLPEEGSPEAMLRLMDRLGIDLVVSSAHLAIASDHIEGNKQVIAANEAYADRILPYLTYNPRYPWEPTLAQAESLRAQGRLYGFKIHTGCHKVQSTDTRYFPLYEYANDLGLPVLSHAWDGTIEGQSALLALSKRYPRMSLIAAHSHNGWEVAEPRVEEARQRDNIYLDMAGSMVVFGMLKWMVSEIGAQKVLFGTDIPFIDARPRLGYVLMADISDDAKRLILGLNAQRIFGL